MSKEFFEPIENTRPFLKMALEGFSGTGKSYTAGLIACGLHDMIKSKKPIALYYTERAGIGSIKKFYDDRKKKVISKESRTLADLTEAIKVCEEGLADILIIVQSLMSGKDSYRDIKRGSSVIAFSSRIGE